MIIVVVVVVFLVGLLAGLVLPSRTAQLGVLALVGGGAAVVALLGDWEPEGSAFTTFLVLCVVAIVPAVLGVVVGERQRERRMR